MNQLVSIIIPCYNQAQFLPETLQSVLEQTYSNWECIIVNDGSPDDTDKVAKEWLVKDKRFKYIYKKNGGLSSARNAGIELANGKWVQFLDSDDCIHSDKLKMSIEIINNKPTITLVVSQFKMFNTSINQLNETAVNYNQNSLTYENILFHWGDTFVIPIHCGFFNLSIIKQIKFNEDFKAIEDWIMWLNFFKTSEEAIYLDRPLAFYRNNINSMTKDYVLIQKNLLKAYRYIYNSLSRDESEKFIFLILERLSKKNIDQKTKIQYLELKSRNNFKSLIKKILFKINLVRNK
jgi:glycosyltransferase involved in cell wall biosynthesis